MSAAQLNPVYQDSVNGKLYVNEDEVEIPATNLPSELAANVQPRPGTLAALMALAGLVGETSYPTDFPQARVLHNGVAGEAVMLFAANGMTRMYGDQRVTGAGASGSERVASDWVTGGNYPVEGFSYHPAAHGTELIWELPVNADNDPGLTIFLDRAVDFYSSISTATPEMALTIHMRAPNCNTIRAVWDVDGTATPYLPATNASKYELVQSAEEGSAYLRHSGPQTVATQSITATAQSTDVSLWGEDALKGIPNVISLNPVATYATHTCKLPYLAKYLPCYGHQLLLIHNPSGFNLTALTVTAYETIRGAAVTSLLAGVTVGYIPSVTGWQRVF